MNIVILAAGKGSRLGSLTENTPKCLVEISEGLPMLSNTLNAIAKSGIKYNKIILVVNTFAEMIKGYCSTRYRSIDIIFVHQKELNGTYGAILSAKEIISGDEFLVLPGDDYLSANDLNQFVSSGACVGVSQSRMPSKYLCADIKNSRLVGLRKQTELELKQGANIINGVYRLDSSFFDIGIKKNYQGEKGIPHTLLSAEVSPEYTYYLFSDWLPMNTLENLHFIKNKLKLI